MDKSKESSVGSYGHDKWEERYTSALTLITIGIVLLLNTTGVLSWSVWWEFIKFWPVFIISAGISLILSFNTFAKFIANIIGYLLFVTIMFFAAVNTGSPAFERFATSVPRLDFFPGVFFNKTSDSYSEESSKEIAKADYPEVTDAKLSLESEIGYFSFSGMTSDNVLAKVYLLSDGSDRFDLDATSTAGVLNVDFNTDHDSRLFWNNNPKYYFTLANDFQSIDLDYTIGAGKAEIDLINDLKMDEVNVDIGAGEVDLLIEETSLPRVLTLTIGAGDMEVKLPETVGVKVDYQVGVGSFRVGRDKLAAGLGQDGTYKSDNYDEATSKIEIKVEVGVGNLDIVFK
ncbi:MAG TPA: LiaF-related protein [Candidatus Dojkabacteria bacterium]|nr:LiaF-related protein [Candidatus Dojkabacteria bacterium]